MCPARKTDISVLLYVLDMVEKTPGSFCQEGKKNVN